VCMCVCIYVYVCVCVYVEGVICTLVLCIHLLLLKVLFVP